MRQTLSFYCEITLYFILYDTFIRFPLEVSFFLLLLKKLTCFEKFGLQNCGHLGA